jgi:DMSO reductase family type II enzyme heme b subunit
MKVETTQSPAEDLNDPSAAVWRDLTSETVSLSPVPLAAQPNEYIRVSRADKPYGATGEAVASALNNGEQLFVRLEWQDDETPNTEFADAAAIVTGRGDEIQSMGSEDAPVGMWYWASDREQSLSLVSSGPGVVRNNTEVVTGASASLDGGRWAVVLSGPSSEVTDNKIGVAIWNGSNDERAGLAAISGWLSLDTE